MTTAIHAQDNTRVNAKKKAEPESPRKGIFFDSGAKQFATRIGYVLDLSTGQRKRDVVKRLGSQENAAVVEHAQLQQRWDVFAVYWDRWREAIRPGLPACVRDIADLSKPFWILPEWIAAARAVKEHSIFSVNATIATTTVGVIDSAKEDLRKLTGSNSHWLDAIPPELRTRVLAAMAPTIHEVRGVAVDAKVMTLSQAVEAFKSYKRSKVGLVLTGRRGGIKGATLGTIGDDLGRVLKVSDGGVDLRELTHERLEKIVDDAYRKWGERTAFNTMRTFKGMLDWCHRTSSFDYRHTDTIDEIFRLTRPETKRKDSYDAATIERLKQLKAACDLTVEKGGEETWLFVLLGLNCGMYQVDIASLTYDNLRFDDKQPYLWWQRQKEMHHNPNLWTRHDLLPEVWKRMQKNLAPKDKKRNPSGRLFLSSRGTELRRVGQDRSKTCLISLRFRRARENAKDAKGKAIELDLPFQQLRKIALNAVKKYSGGSDDVTRKFAGQKQPGILKHYLQDDFGDVSAALTKWGDELRKDGIV